MFILNILIRKKYFYNMLVGLLGRRFSVSCFCVLLVVATGMQPLGTAAAGEQAQSELFIVNTNGAEAEVLVDYFSADEVIRNAVEALRDAPNPSLRINCRADLADESVVIRVQDNGCGMSGKEVVRYINQLSASSAIQSTVWNYGVGAKIADRAPTTTCASPAAIRRHWWCRSVSLR